MALRRRVDKESYSRALPSPVPILRCAHGHSHVYSDRSSPWFFCGLFVVAFHQYWRSIAAVIISLFGWFLLLRGFALLAVPQLVIDAATSAAQTSGPAVGLVRVGFGLLALCGLYLAYVGWVKKVD
jgi:hypothetical protein